MLSPPAYIRPSAVHTACAASHDSVPRVVMTMSAVEVGSTVTFHFWFLPRVSRPAVVTLAVALPEAREESGLDVRALDHAIFDIDVHRFPARGGEPAHLHFDVRFVVQAEHDRFKVSDESHALAWVPAVGLNALTDEESVLRMARKWVVRRADGDKRQESAKTISEPGSQGR